MMCRAMAVSRFRFSRSEQSCNAAAWYLRASASVIVQPFSAAYFLMSANSAPRMTISKTSSTRALYSIFDNFIFLDLRIDPFRVKVMNARMISEAELLPIRIGSQVCRSLDREFLIAEIE